MFERTRVTLTFLAERPMTEEESERAAAGATRHMVGMSGQCVYGAIVVEQTTVLSDE